MSLTPYYESLLKQAHQEHIETGKGWGTTGGRNFGGTLLQFLERRKDIGSVLDFGCGHGTLGEYILSAGWGGSWTNYDPGLLAYSDMPSGEYDLVVSSDVLEHLEPDHVDSTIEELRSLAKKAMFHHIACQENKGRLPDGRDAHLSVHEPRWWREKFDHPDWTLMLAGDMLVRKRSYLRRHCILQYDRG